MKRHLPCGATGPHSVTCYPTQMNASKLGRQVLDLPTLEGWKAELTLLAGYILRWLTRLQTVTRLRSNHLSEFFSNPSWSQNP